MTWVRFRKILLSAIFLVGLGCVWKGEVLAACSLSKCGDCATVSACTSAGCSWTYNGNYCYGSVTPTAVPTAVPTPKPCSYNGTTYSNGSNRCTGGTLYKCNNGSWSFYVNCNEGYCRDNSACASCSVGSTGCSGTRRWYCSSGSTVYVDCAYGCTSGVCNQPECNSGDEKCQNGQICSCVGGKWSCSNCSYPQDYCYQSGATSAGCTYKCSYYSGICHISAYCSAIGGVLNGKWDCEFMNAGCCVGGGTYDPECNSDSDCAVYGDCWTCDDVPIGTSSYTYKKCVEHKTTGLRGSCASLGSVCSLPASGLCSSSYGSTVTDSSGTDGTFNWTCSGQSSTTCRTAGSSASCSAGKLSLVNGVCGVDDGTCSAGSVYDVGTTAVRSDGIYSLWSCNGICSGSSANCEHKLCSRVNGLCGSANGGNFATVPTTGLCSSGTASLVATNPTTFVWNCNGSCGGTSESCLATYDTAPSLESTVLETTGGRVIDVEVGGRNHSCDPAFAGSKTSVWTITATDVQGVTDIKSMTLRFRGPVTVNTSPVAAVNGVSNFSVDTTTFTPGTYNVEVLIDDIHNPPGNRGWIDTGRDFKVWDCLVNISGTFYDGSEVPISCSANSGYTDLIPSGINFDLRYQIGTSAPRIMTVNSPNFSADNNNRLYWNSPVDYQPQLAYFPGTDPTQARINGNCYNTSALDPKIADPYLTNPSLTIEYSTVLDQSAWYRASGGAIITKGTLTNYVPGTCTAANCMTVAGNIILSDGKASLSPYDKINSNIVYDNQTVDFKLYSYDTLKRKYFFTKGYGTTVPASITNWTDVETKSGVIFVEGDLTIDTNIATTDLVMIVAKGDITINPNVTRVDGILFGKSITASGESASQLVINGSIYGLNSVVLNRSFNPKKSNNTTPAVEVRYNPSLIFKLPAKMIKILLGGDYCSEKFIKL